MKTKLASYIREGDEVWGGWAGIEVDWRLGEWSGPEGGGQWNKLQLETSN